MHPNYAEAKLFALNVVVYGVCFMYSSLDAQTHTNTNAPPPPHTPKQAQERNEYDAFLRRNYFSAPSEMNSEDTHLLHLTPGEQVVRGDENDRDMSETAEGSDGDVGEAGREGEREGDVHAGGGGDDSGGEVEDGDREALWNARGNQ
jgi:hypothetical protein